MLSVNLTAVAVASVCGFVLGILWYAPFLFGRRWDRAAQGNDASVPRRRASIGVILITLVFNFAAAYLLAVYMPNDPIAWTVPISAAIGLGCVASSLGISYAFTGRPMAILLIDGGFHVVRFALMGLILGLWH